MESQERILFDLLLKKVKEKLNEQHPEVTLPIKDWRGDDIAILREDLQVSVNGTISEKWFYTHIKNDQGKLPRIDTLNLLCEYADCQSWSSFCHQNRIEKEMISPEKSLAVNPSEDAESKFGKVWTLMVGVILIVAVVVIIVMSKGQGEPQYKFCFIDQNTHLPVVDSFLEVKMIKTDETPLLIPLKGSCVEGEGSRVDFIVKGRFYKSMQIKRTIQNDVYEESIFLEPDDYAMILHLFTNSKVDDWKQRRKQMSEMMNDNLKAYELTKDGFTIDVLTKDEFINKMTLPTRVLKHVSIVQTDYEGDKISLIKFTQE